MIDSLEFIWKSHLEDLEKEKKRLEEDGKSDYILDSLLELLRLAVQCEQYKRTFDDYEKVIRVVKIKIYGFKKSTLERIFKVPLTSVYGQGLYVPLEGILQGSRFRTRSNYDSYKTQGKFYDVSSLPENIQSEYDFRLSVPALSSLLFTPKKSVITEWLNRRSQLQYFDLE